MARFFCSTTCFALLLFSAAASGADAPETAAKPDGKPAAQQDQTAANEPRQIPTKGTMLVRVVGADGQPIEGAKLFANVNWLNQNAAKPNWVIDNQHYLTGRDGTAEIKLPKLVEDVRLWARKEGQVPMFAIWWPKVDPKLAAMPEEFTYHLQTGTTLGGMVTNDAGEPIVGVNVEVSYHGTNFRKTGGRAVFDNWLALGDGAVGTDSNGRWQLNNVPPGDDIDVRLRLSHSKYLGDDDWGRLQREQHITLAALRDETAVIVMPRGSVVSGKVTDSEGRPLKDAVVIWGDRPAREPGSQEVRTDDQGTYRFPPLPPGLMHVTVVAEGWMPIRTEIQIPRRPLPLDFALKQGNKLQLRFIDESGETIPRVEVTIRKWQGAESLYNDQDPELVRTRVPRKAGFDGVYEWHWAPDSPVEFEFVRPGYAKKTASIAADGREHVITLTDAAKPSD